MIALFILCLILAMFGLIASKNNILSPSVITPTVWMVVLSLFMILNHNLPPLSGQFLGALALWVTMLCLGSLFTQSLRVRAYPEHKPSRLVLDIFFWISLATYPLFLLFVKEALATGTSGNWAMDLRLAALGRTETFTEVYGGLHIALWHVAYLLELFCYSPKNRHRVIILGLMFLSFGLGTMSKLILLEFIINTVAVLLFKRKVSVKHFVVALGVLLLVFATIQSMRQRDQKFDQNNFFVLYVLGNASAFDTLEPGSAEHYGENVFRVYYAITEKLGYSSIEPIDPLLPFIDKPLNTNTYTGMYPFFKDFGYWGVGIFALLYGLIFGWVFKKAQQGTPFFIILNAILVFALATQYVADLVITNIAGYIKQVLLLMLPFIANYKIETDSFKNGSVFESFNTPRR